MRYITFDGDETRTYKSDYNTAAYTEDELIEICDEWTKEDDDGTVYYLSEEDIDGDYIRRLRKSTGLSQAKFAELTEIPVRTLEKWESGERTPPPYVIKLLEYWLENERGH